MDKTHDLDAIDKRKNSHRCSLIGRSNSDIVGELGLHNCKISGKGSLVQALWMLKRNLAFENLPMELWHPKNAVISNMDFALNWQKSISQCGQLDCPVKAKNGEPFKYHFKFNINIETPDL
ncbi:hypothetical protein CEXT_21911 [Caerostris extrusa]|uniref:Uncharacterized protein n=1 Tax=Caerostris extrusa TaxID=172846 RepID=A0AAV4MJE7_CAEEX|nr:hypothetical protein CEXT_21911 [Caerostris extrusa]